MQRNVRQNQRIWIAVIALTLLAVLRVAASYKNTAQGFDEPCHVAAAIELLAKGTYALDPVHPPLSRIGIGLPLYLAGERYPQLSPFDPESQNYNVVGNAILRSARNRDFIGFAPPFIIWRTDEFAVLFAVVGCWAIELEWG